MCEAVRASAAAEYMDHHDKDVLVQAGQASSGAHKDCISSGSDLPRRPNIQVKMISGQYPDEEDLVCEAIFGKNTKRRLQLSALS